jgi:hypothetical protein
MQKKMNPSTARSSKARQEEFIRKKSEERKMQGNASSPGLDHQCTGEKGVIGRQAAGNASSSTKRLVLDLDNKEVREVGTSTFSPIPQVDGIGEGSTQQEAKKQTWNSV